MLALTIPWLLVLLTIAAIVSLIKKKWKVALLLAVVAITLNWWSDCYCFGFKENYKGDIKVLSLNANGAGIYDVDKANGFVELVEKENADFLFLTETFSPLGDSLYLKLKDIYPYATRVFTHNVVYSKLPISDIKFSERLNEGTSYIVHCCVSIRGNDVKIVGCHLSSNNYSQDLDYITPDQACSLKDIGKYLGNVENASCLREKEAIEIAEIIEGNTKVIVMGDFNDVCGSPAFRILKQSGMTDAWSRGGFGYGATIHRPLPFRIDHILYGGGLILKGVKKINTGYYSDHDALVAVFDFSSDIK